LCRSTLKGRIYQVQLPYRGPINITVALHHAKKEKIQHMSAMKTTAYVPKSAIVGYLNLL
jgi:hypothetical protein